LASEFAGIPGYPDAKKGRREKGDDAKKGTTRKRRRREKGDVRPFYAISDAKKGTYVLFTPISTARKIINVAWAGSPDFSGILALPIPRR
jgi:hypothetical protein